MRIPTITAVLFLALQSTGTPKGSIEGQVLRAGTDIQLKDVTINLRQVSSQSATSQVSIAPVTTDSTGRFVFPSIDPGSYAAYATAEGYSIQFYGVKGSGYTGRA